ncbi:MAG: phosphatase PAP2 family protein [Chlamydiae bacterium]|nr:phosphatase PAP2 family protein [Chlamydiota bacterium]
MQHIELSWIQALQGSLRCPFLDNFFIGWNYVDSFAFAIILIPIVWQLLGRQKGIKIFYILILSRVINHSLKEYFGLPRPCQVDPSVGILCFSSYGFPSGAAQTAILLAGITFIEYKRALYRIFAVIFALFLCFSRIYLGVHYFSDILGGLLSGSIVLLVYWKLFPLMEKHWKKAFLIFPLALILIGGKDALLFCFLTLGVQIGLLTGGKIPSPKRSLSRRWGQAAIIILGLFILSVASELPHLVQLACSLIMGMWLSFVGEKLTDQIFPYKR